ncbi:glycosyl hydrolase 53 family protein [Maribacter sp. 2307ULW6-5]|uniref:glycosyl hydrolase 53 family protein n=1 Tax=Maribacter sp. 2307ULW6-5 TaxID=3386275 RepID=UPI0039BD370E
MKAKHLPYLFILGPIFLGCSGNGDDTAAEHTQRTFGMGFTSWSFGPQMQDVDATYAFIENNADIYTEHIDTNIPWKAWMDNGILPTPFTNDILGRSNRRMPNKQLLLSVSPLNQNRDELALDFDGTLPEYTSLDDANIANAYVKHINYLVNQFAPDYLVIGIEVNELRMRSPEKWQGYTALMEKVTLRIKEQHPDLPISQSISLHNFYGPIVAKPEQFIEDIVQHIDRLDFVAISFYPFFKNQATPEEFQAAFNFLHQRTNKPIAIVETAHLAEDLSVPSLNVSIAGNEAQQNRYLQTLFANAQQEGYLFVIWWAHRDFDRLWETFPEEVRDLGKLWRDTGLLDEGGRQRQAFGTWQAHLNRR